MQVLERLLERSPPGISARPYREPTCRSRWGKAYPWEMDPTRYSSVGSPLHYLPLSGQLSQCWSIRPRAMDGWRKQRVFEWSTRSFSAVRMGPQRLSGSEHGNARDEACTSISSATVQPRAMRWEPRLARAENLHAVGQETTSVQDRCPGIRVGDKLRKPFEWHHAQKSLEITPFLQKIDRSQGNSSRHRCRYVIRNLVRWRWDRHFDTVNIAHCQLHIPKVFEASKSAKLEMKCG